MLRLVAMGTAESAEAMVQAFVDVRHVVSDRAFATVREVMAGLTAQADIDVVCDWWSRSGHRDLEELIKECGWVATGPPRARALSALLVGRRDLLADASPEIADFLAYRASLPRQLAEEARLALSGLNRQDARDSACRQALSTGSGPVLDLLSECGFLPSDPSPRAAMLFLSGRFERYDELDADGSLLRAEHEAGNGRFRALLAARARSSGRGDWVRIVAGCARADQELDDGEWESAIDLLVKARHWDGLWSLALVAPPSWAAQMLRELDRQDWLPRDVADRAGAASLIALAGECPEAAPAGVGYRHSSTVDRNVFGHRPFAMSADGSLLAVLYPDGNSVTLCDPRSGWGRGEVRGLSGRDSLLALTPDASLLIVAARSGSVELRALPSGEVTDRCFVGGGVNALAVSTDGQWLAVATAGVRPRVWRLRPEGRLEGSDEYGDESIPSTAIAAAPEGPAFVSGNSNGELRRWSVESRAMPVGEAVEAGEGEITQLVVPPLRNIVIAASPRGGLWMWGGGGDVVSLEAPRVPGPFAVTATPDGRFLVIGGSRESVKLWRLKSASKPGWVPTADLGKRSADAEGLAMTPDGHVLVVVTREGVQFWRARLPEIAATPVGRIDLAELAALRGQGGLGLRAERAWFGFVEALVTWPRRSEHEIQAGE